MILSKSLSQVGFTPSAPPPPAPGSPQSSQQTAATVSTGPAWGYYLRPHRPRGHDLHFFTCKMGITSPPYQLSGSGSKGLMDVDGSTGANLEMRLTYKLRVSKRLVLLG